MGHHAGHTDHGNSDETVRFLQFLIIKEVQFFVIHVNWEEIKAEAVGVLNQRGLHGAAAGGTDEIPDRGGQRSGKLHVVTVLSLPVIAASGNQNPAGGTAYALGQKGDSALANQAVFACFNALHNDPTTGIILVEDFPNVGVKIFQIQLKLIGCRDTPEINAVTLFPKLILQTLLIDSENTVFV